MSRTLVAAGLAAVVTAAAGTAHAQYWLGDRALNEGHGFRVGDFEIHPGIGVEFGYNSNTLLRPSNEVMGSGMPGIVPSLVLRVTPSISIGTLSGRRLQESGGVGTEPPTAIFRANIGATYYHFFPLTSPDVVSSLSNVGGQAGVLFHLFPQRTWQFLLRDDVARAVPGSPDLFAFGTALPLYQGIRNVGSADLIFAPNNGILDIRLSYTNTLMYFENQQIQYYNNMGNVIALRAHWRFLPRTSLMWEGGVAPTFYFGSGSPTGLFSSHPMYTRFGLNGLLTQRIQLLLLVGWTSTYFAQGDNANTVIAQAEIKYIFGPLTSFAFGLQRDVQPSFVGNYYVRNRAYLQFTRSFAGRFWLSATGSAGIDQYGFATDPAGNFDMTRVIGADAGGHWNAVRIEATLFGEYRFTDWFGLNATLLANANLPLGGVTLNEGTGTAVAIDWFDFQAFAGVRFSY